MSKAFTLFLSPFSLPNSFRCFHFVVFLSLCLIHCFPSLLSFAFPQSIFPFRSFHPKYLKLKKNSFLTPWNGTKKTFSYSYNWAKQTHWYAKMPACIGGLVDWKYTSELPDPCKWMRSKGQKEHSKGNKLNLEKKLTSHLQN